MNFKCCNTMRKGLFASKKKKKKKQTVNGEKLICMYQEYYILQLYQVKIVEVSMNLK